MSALDGLTILRYGHVYASGGGVEQYLQDLNGTLHAQNDLHTFQVQLTSDPARIGETGDARLRKVSLFVDQRSHELAISGTDDESGLPHRAKAWLRGHVLFRPPLYGLVTRPLIARRRVPRRAGEPDAVGRTVLGLHRRRPLDLICLHSAGGADVDEILAVAAAEGIPAIYVHHFANDRLAGFSVGAQLDRLAGVAGVCGAEVPAFLRPRFQVVSDGIDTDFFRRDRAAPAVRDPARPVIFLPARLTPAKGQADLIRAAGELRRRGLDFRVVFAGRTDTPDFLVHLQSLIAQEGVAEHVEFAGQLGPGGLRDRYAAAALVAFPTRHHEGLPRILLECQAMEVPPVVYRIGGTAEGVRDGETGFVTGPGDFGALVDRLARLLQDEPLRLRFGRAGRSLVGEKFSLAALAARHEQFYLQALTNAGRAPALSTR